MGKQLATGKTLSAGTHAFTSQIWLALGMDGTVR